MPYTTRLITESLDGDRVILRTACTIDHDVDQFHPPSPAEAIAHSAALWQHLTELIDGLRPLLTIEAYNALSDAASNLETGLRREFFSRLIALAVETLDVWPVSAEAMRPAVIVVPWVKEDAS